MRIQHNISALNAANRLKANDNAISKNIAKLSSGYRINNAADDAAGLAVSEKMRAQINGLNQAQSNAENGISLVQTAEGGLNETEAILQRMNTLAVESANGTYQDSTDRANLNKEVVALQSEIDRISTSTNFNQINLLDGSLSTGSSGVAASAVLGFAPASATLATVDATNNVYGIAVDKSNITLAPPAATGDAVTYSISYKDSTGTQKTTDITLTYNDATKQITDNNGNTYPTTSEAPAADDWDTAIAGALTSDPTLSKAFTYDKDAKTLTAVDAGASNGEQLIGISVSQYNATNKTTETLNGTTAPLSTTTTVAHDAYQTAKGFKVYDGTNANKAVFTVNGQKFAFVAAGQDASALTGVNVVYKTAATDSADIQSMSSLINSKTGLATTVEGSDFAGGTINFISGTTKGTAGGALTFQIGSENKDDQRVSLSVADMSSKGLGVEGVTIATQDEARAAIDTIKTAINTVSATRADLGALQNRLEHTTNNLSTMSENLTSAESSIRDVDMADEYVQYSKNQILSQAATAMLTQANAQPQNVLSLLKG